MQNYLGARLLMVHIDQYLTGVTPGGDAAMADFFQRHHVRPADVVNALEVTGRGDAATVAQYVSEHPELKAWYDITPTLKAP
jgi:hypothetical protein